MYIFQKIHVNEQVPHLHTRLSALRNQHVYQTPAGLSVLLGAREAKEYNLTE